MDFHSIFQLSSATKIITAVAALQCVERGLIGLDDPTIDHLPELAAQQIAHLNNNDSGESKVELRPRKGGAITLQHLLTHTSGLGPEHMDPTLQAWRRSRVGTSAASECNALDAFNNPATFRARSRLELRCKLRSHRCSCGSPQRRTWLRTVYAEKHLWATRAELVHLHCLLA